MSVHEHSRFKVVSGAQHLLEHSLSEFQYSNPAIPGGTLNLEEAMDYVFSVLYPRTKPSVATPADLPTGLNTPNPGDVAPTAYDQRIVEDDGDGKAAMYSFFKADGDVAATWHKVADIDWGMDTVIQALEDGTLYFYYKKYGNTDYDPLTELPYAGKAAGQHLYGGNTANQNLTLHATNGDDPGDHTGYVQSDDDFRPVDDLVYDLGTATERWKDLYVETAIIGTGTMTITSDNTQGSITDTSGIIDFDDETLQTLGNIFGQTIEASVSFVVDDTVDTMTIGVDQIESSSGAIDFIGNNLQTTGTLDSGTHTITAGLETLVIGQGSIVDSSGAIDFGDNDLDTTGDVTAAGLIAGSANIDDVFINGNTITTDTIDADLIISSNGLGIVQIASELDTLGISSTGIVDILGSLSVDNITIDGNDIVSDTGTISLSSHFVPSTNNTYDLGTAALLYRDAFIAQAIKTATQTFLTTELMSLRDVVFRDFGRTLPAQAGDSLFYDAVNGVWLASSPDTEIDHSSISGLTTGDAGHTQFAMLAGRVGGQTVNGGTVAGNQLLLRNNSNQSSGIDIRLDQVVPYVDTTVDLGSVALRYGDLYLDGQAYGLRAQNGTAAAIAGLFAGAELGRLFFGTDTGFLYVNDGASNRKVGHNTYNQLKTEAQLALAIDVSASVDDARNCIWQLADTANGDEIMGVVIQKTLTTVTISNDVPLPVGNYRLIGIEV
jgi:hypothetical protein